MRITFFATLFVCATACAQEIPGGDVSGEEETSQAAVVVKIPCEGADSASNPGVPQVRSALVEETYQPRQTGPVLLRGDQWYLNGRSYFSD